MARTKNPSEPPKRRGRPPKDKTAQPKKVNLTGLPEPALNPKQKSGEIVVRGQTDAKLGVSGKPEKHAGGRPTLYRPELCDILPDMFREGQSVLEVSVELGVCKDTIYEWAKVYPEFSAALTRGKAISQAWWERQGRLSLNDESMYDAENKISTSKKFNQNLWAKNMACRFRDDWQEKTAVEVDSTMVIKHTFDPEGL